MKDWERPQSNNSLVACNRRLLAEQENDRRSDSNRGPGGIPRLEADSLAERWLQEDLMCVECRWNTWTKRRRDGGGDGAVRHGGKRNEKDNGSRKGTRNYKMEAEIGAEIITREQKLEPKAEPKL